MSLKRLIYRTFFALSVGLALLLVVDIHGVVDSLRDIKVGDLWNLFVLSIALIVVSVIKWRAFLRRLGVDASIWRLFRLYLIGYFVNLLMPSSIGGDVVRSLYVQSGGDKLRSVSATFLERYTGLLAMIAMATIGVLWAPQITPQIKVLVLALSLGSIGGTALLVSGKLIQLVRYCRLPSSIIEKVTRLQGAVKWGLSDRKLVLQVAILSIAFHLLTVINTAVVGNAIGWRAIPIGDLIVVVPLILLVGAIPISPQGLGIQEGAFVFFLASIGAAPEQALAIALVLRAKSYILAIFGGMFWLRMHRAK